MLEIEDFKATVSESANLLTGIKAIADDLVDQRLIDYLRNLDKDPVGLKLLRNAITPK